jgi:hypothetical protein
MLSHPPWLSWASHLPRAFPFPASGLTAHARHRDSDSLCVSSAGLLSSPMRPSGTYWRSAVLSTLRENTLTDPFALCLRVSKSTGNWPLLPCGSRQPVRGFCPRPALRGCRTGRAMIRTAPPMRPVGGYAARTGTITTPTAASMSVAGRVPCKNGSGVRMARRSVAIRTGCPSPRTHA